jgi:hypothetical protein
MACWHARPAAVAGCSRETVLQALCGLRDDAAGLSICYQPCSSCWLQLLRRLFVVCVDVRAHRRMRSNHLPATIHYRDKMLSIRCSAFDMNCTWYVRICGSRGMMCAGGSLRLLRSNELVRCSGRLSDAVSWCFRCQRSSMRSAFSIVSLHRRQHLSASTRVHGCTLNGNFRSRLFACAFFFASYRLHVRNCCLLGARHAALRTKQNGTQCSGCEVACVCTPFCGRRPASVWSLGRQPWPRCWHVAK